LGHDRLFRFISEVEIKAKMPTYINKGNYLLVELDEQYSLDLFFTTIHEVAEQCEKEGLNKALVDITKMTGNPNMIDRYETGILMAKVWGDKIKVAAVAKKSLINYLAENAAINRGARFKVFSEINPALEWLAIKE
jgi:hypothetical protein